MNKQQIQTLKLEIFALVSEKYPDSNFQVKVEIEEEGEVLIFINWMDGPTWGQVKELTQAIEDAEEGRYIFPQRSYSDRARRLVIEATKGQKIDVDKELRARQF